MLPHEERVVQEQLELKTKLDKLKAFLHSNTFSDLGRTEKLLLRMQERTMQSYHEILTERITNFIRE